jgi:site-specific DNA recombinase
MGGWDELLANCRLAQSVLCDCTEIDAELEELRREIEVVSELTRKSIYENARFAVNQDEFNERHQGYMERHRIATEQVAELEDQRRNRQNKSLILDGFIREIEIRPLVIKEFDEKLWSLTVDKVMVHRDGRLEFTFKDGISL